MIKQEMMQGWRGDVAALVGGLLLLLAFAPFEQFWLSFVSLAFLTISWLWASPGRAFFRGWLFGLGQFGLGVSWINVSMNQFGGMSMPLSVFLTTIFVLFLALFPGLVGYLFRRLFNGNATHSLVSLLLVLPALWVAVEIFRAKIFTGFPWLSLGYSQIDSPLAGFAPIMGVFAVSFAVMVTVGLLVWLSLDFSQRSKKAIPGLLVLWLVPFGFNQVSWSTQSGEPFSVSLIQGNVAQDIKWLPDQLIPTLDLYANLSRANWGQDLIIWPETAIPAFYHKVKPFLKAIAQEARMNGSEVLLGIPVLDERTKRYYNAMVSMGGVDGFYEKRHLVPFGEYLPLKDTLGGLIDFFQIPMSDFSLGSDESPPVLNLANQVAGISICYEDVFGEEVIAALPEATFLVNASNDAWFGESVAPWQHLEIARMRSLETARYLVRSTNTGVSAIIDEKGKIVGASPQFETHVLNADVIPFTGLTPFAVFGNLPVILSLFAILLINAWISRARNKSATA